MARLDGKRVLITGASSGIGAAAARAFADEGADLALLARGEPGLQRVARCARRRGASAHVIPTDVAERDSTERAVAAGAARLDGLDVLVINAAAMVFGPFKEVEPREFDRTIDVTFTGAVDAIRAALPHLERSGGTIVVTGSLMSKLPLPGFSSYAAAKHALRGFLGSLRVELRAQRSPVRIAMVHPGPVDSPLWGHLTSATGRLPRQPPEGYSPETIARELVAAAVRPRPEVTIGGEARALELLWTLARPVAELALVAVDRWYRSGRRPAPQPGALWEAAGAGDEDGSLIGRPSLVASARRLPRALDA